MSCVSLGRYEKAFESYKAAIDAQPDYAAAYNNYSNALLDVQRLSDALKNIEKVLALDPDFPYALGQRLTIKSHMCDWKGSAPRATRWLKRSGAVRSPARRSRWSPPM